MLEEMLVHLLVLKLKKAPVNKIFASFWEREIPKSNDPTEMGKEKLHLKEGLKYLWN